MEKFDVKVLGEVLGQSTGYDIADGGFSGYDVELNSEPGIVHISIDFNFVEGVATFYNVEGEEYMTKNIINLVNENKR